MSILSFDLASRQSGWVLFNSDGTLSDRWGLITPRPLSLTAEQRLPIIKKAFESILNDYPEIKLVLIEQPAGGTEDKKGPDANWLTMSVLFMTHGVIRCMLEERKIKWELISPSTWQNRLGFHKRDRASRKKAAKDYAVKTYELITDNLEQDIYDAICLHDAYQFMKNYKTDSEEESAF